MTTRSVGSPEISAENESFRQLALQRGALDLTKSVGELRQLAELTAENLRRKEFVFQGTSTEEIIKAKDDDGMEYDLPVTIIKPSVDQTAAIIVYFHGGGWVWSSRKTHQQYCEMLASQTDCVVVNVEYRLAPEHKFPECYTDACNAVRSTLSNRKTLSGRDDCPVGVAGDSAGGNMSASVCHLMDEIAFQLLIYPSLNLNADAYESYTKYMEGHLLTKELMNWFRDHFLRDMKTDILNPVGSPMLREDFSKLPPTLLLPSEKDALADQATEYYDKLCKAGVKSELVLMEGVLHGYVTKPGYFTKTVDMSIDVINNFLISVL